VLGKISEVLGRHGRDNRGARFPEESYLLPICVLRICTGSKRDTLLESGRTGAGRSSMAAAMLVTKLLRLASERRAALLKMRPEATTDYRQFR
jgi:hypothetical protein